MNSETESTSCPCGWSHASTRVKIAAEEIIIERCTTGDCSLHPFRQKIIANSRQRIATLQSHLEGRCPARRIKCRN